jgi:DNA-binding NarL/FixJ family response regulator
MNSISPPRLRILLVDDAPIVRHGLFQLLEDQPGLEVIGEADNVTDALDAIARLRPDVVILDMQLGAGSGLEVLKSCKRVQPAPVFIVFTFQPSLQEACIQAGADFFFSKGCSVEQMLQAFVTLRERRHPRAGGSQLVAREECVP